MKTARLDKAQQLSKWWKPEVDAFSVRRQHQEIGHIIAAIRNPLQSIGIAKLERHISKLTSANSKDREQSERMVGRIVNKILHPLIARLKLQASALSGAVEYPEALALAFSANSDKKRADDDV